MFVEGLKFPMKDEKWVIKIIIGSVLIYIPIVDFIVLGYIVETFENVINGEEKLPEWDNLKDKFIKGFAYSFYWIILLIVLFVIALLSRYFNFSKNLIDTLLLLWICIYLVLLFIYPMAIANYAIKKRFSALFKFKEILMRIKSVFGRYVLAYIILILVGVIFGIILAIISMIPIIGYILYIFGVIFGTFYLSLVSAYYFGVLYRESSNG
ncbi:conserved membrane protein of unknown function [Methanocaldococcus lauensis]|uniref:DUF4013 domain-containing protein n=1 Tax=Methanocaldococcus lauensis TaxID=2546128 RepID=A0A8D6PU96_9EURY|nr:DUF4013 domain-containing protein [Methanocaldococcus lauensis]CAB3287362.1 conserved membrane protein of unknown function [Methanocaldococcus lauensis]